MSTAATKIDKSIAGKEFYNTSETAVMLGLNKDTVRHYCQGQKPRIKGIKIGRDWLISKSEIDRYARDRRDVGRPPSEQ